MSRVQAKIEAARQALEEGKAISPDARRSKGSPLSPYRTIDGECEDGNAMGRASFPMGKRNRYCVRLSIGVLCWRATDVLDLVQS